MAPVSAVSLVDTEQSQQVKKRFYIPCQDEYSSSSGPLNGLVLSSILRAMPACPSSRRPLKHGYLADLVREGGISPCSLLLGLIYIQRLSRSNPDYLATVSSRDVFLIAMVVASKYMNDEGEMEALTNSEWATIGCTSKTTLDELERNFLRAIDWRLYVPLQEFYAFVGSAEGRVAMEQACRRGWTTYTDLTTMWENSDLQASMMKHTAKVAFSGVSFYLVCVSTLMAALHPLGLFNHVHPDTPTFSSPALQLQSDPLPSAPNLSTQNFDGSSLGAAQRLVSLQEEWPGGGRACLWDPALIPDGGGGGGTCPPHSTWQQCLLKSDHTLNQTHFIDTGHKPIQNTRKNFYQDRSHVMEHSVENWNRSIMSLGPPSVLNSTSAPPLPPSYTSPTRASSPLLPTTPVPPIPPSSLDTRPVPPSSLDTRPVPPIPPPSSPVNRCNASGKGPPLLAARVGSLYAEDLDYHSKGTSHWPPLNASSQEPGGGGGSVTGALTFIAHYFTPQWVM